MSAVSRIREQGFFPTQVVEVGVRRQGLVAARPRGRAKAKPSRP